MRDKTKKKLSYIGTSIMFLASLLGVNISRIHKELRTSPDNTPKEYLAPLYTSYYCDKCASIELLYGLKVNYLSGMDFDSSTTIKFSFFRATDQIVISLLESEGRITETLRPVVVPEHVSGEEYEARATATLVAPGFDIAGGTSAQSLDQQEVTWQWVISPKKEGQQTFYISLLFEWKNKKADEAIQRQIQTKEFQIDVSRSFITLGQLNIGTILMGLIGAGLAVPRFIDLILKLIAWIKRKRRRTSTVGFITNSNKKKGKFQLVLDKIRKLIKLE